MLMGFFQKKCYFDLIDQQNKLSISNQDIDFSPLLNQNHDQLLHTILISILNCFPHCKISKILKLDLIKTEKNNQKIDKIFQQILNYLDHKNYKIENIAMHMSLQKPKLCQKDINYKFLIRDNLCKLFNISKDHLVVQAGTGEKIGDIGNSKAIIFISNISLAKQNNSNKRLVGFGYDRHRFKVQSEIEKKPTLCGQKINYFKNIDAHSDGDIVFHAMTNAIFSVTGSGDIGEHFPDTDPQWKNALSIKFLQYALNILNEKKLKTIAIQIEIVTSMKFLNTLKRENFLGKAHYDLMKILNIGNKKNCSIHLRVANEKRKDHDELCIKNDLGIEANVKMIFYG